MKFSECFIRLSSTKKVHHSSIIDLVNLIGGGFDILKVASDILC